MGAQDQPGKLLNAPGAAKAGNQSVSVLKSSVFGKEETSHRIEAIWAHKNIPARLSETSKHPRKDPRMTQQGRNKTPKISPKDLPGAPRHPKETQTAKSASPKWPRKNLKKKSSFSYVFFHRFSFGRASRLHGSAATLTKYRACA